MLASASRSATQLLWAVLRRRLDTPASSAESAPVEPVESLARSAERSAEAERERAEAEALRQQLRELRIAYDAHEARSGEP